MNRALLNPFVSADLPKGIEEILDKDKATCVAFNRHGNLLAVGTATGHVSLWDFDTRSIAAKLSTDRDEKLSVSSVSFPAPRNGSLVLVSYAPGTVRLFDTLSQELLSEVVFDVPIVQAVAHPKVSEIAVVIPQCSHPIILHMRKGIYEVRHRIFKNVRDPQLILNAPATRKQFGFAEAKLDHQQPKRPNNSFGNKVFGVVPPASDSINFSVLCAKEDFDKEGVPKEISGSRKRSYCVAFTRGGDHILRGGPSGLIRSFVLGSDRGKEKGTGTRILTATCISVVCVQGRAAVRGIILSRKSDKVLINSHDRCMRLFLREQIVNPDSDCGNQAAKKNTNPKSSPGEAPLRIVEPITTFTEIVNKTQCRCACFSSDGDYVLGGMEGTEHKIHIWRTVDGHLELTLEGARGGVAQIQWHPLRGVITSVGLGPGQVYVWAKNVTENWSAFATEFSELEANEEYSESETEFDKKEPQDESEVKRAREAAEAATVDVETCNGGAWFSSDSEQEDTYFYIPAKPVRDTINYPPSLADDLIRAKLQEKQEAEDDGSDEVVLVSEDVNDDTRRRRKRSADYRKSRGPNKRGRSSKRHRSAGGDSSAAERWRDDRETGDETVSDNPKGRREVPVVDLEDDENEDPRKSSEAEDQEVQVVENVLVD